MANNIENRRKVLIAAANSEDQKTITEQTSSHIANCQFFYANDGMTAISMLGNDTPDLLIIEKHLAKKNAIQVTEFVLSQKNLSNTAVIIISAIPDQDHFVDEVVMGQVQFTNSYGENLGQYLARALNFVSHGDNAEFNLVFLTPNDVLMKEGDKARSVYILKKGEMKAVTEKTGEKVILGTIAIGEFVGEMAYINGEARSATIIALTDCELIEIPIQKLDLLLFQKPAWSKALVRTLSRRIKKGNTKLADLVSE